MHVFVDVSNLYYCLYHRYRGKLDYSRLLDFLSPVGTLDRAIAYGAQVRDEAANFIKRLNELGFETRYKTPKFYGKNAKADVDVAIAVDMIRMMNDYDTAILCSADGDMLPVLQYLAENNKRLVVVGAGISSELEDVATCIEIPSSMVRRR